MTFPTPEGPPFDIGEKGGAHSIPPSLQPSGPSSGEVEAWRTQLNEMVLGKVTLALQGFYVPDLTKPTAFQQLKDWASTHNVGPLFEILTGIPDANNDDVGTWVNSLLRHHRPVPEVQAASVVDTNPNLLLAPHFEAAGTVVVKDNWSWTNSFGHDSVGCAQVVAAGYISEMVSNEIRVVEGQSLDLSVWVKWSGLSYTGSNPIAMTVTRYLNFAEVGSEDLVVLASPAGTQDWTLLSKTAYIVPAGCDDIRLGLKVGANLTAGTAYWDDAEVIKSQPGSGYIGNVVDNMVNGLENVNQPGWGPIDLLISMLSQFRTTTDHGARITYLETLQSSGNKINDEFLRVAGTLGANWNVTLIGAGAGTWETDGDYAFWNRSGVATREARGRYTGTPSNTVTDNQKIIAILGSKGEDRGAGITSHVDLYGRMNTAGTEGTDYIRARFSANGDVTLTRRLASVDTDLAHIDGYNLLLHPNGPKAPGGGATIALLCGTASGARFFDIQINGVSVLTGSDATSALGAGFRGYGAGVKAEGSILILGQTTPAKLNAWAAIDQ